MGSGTQNLIDQELLPEKIRLIKMLMDEFHCTFEEAYAHVKVRESMAPAVLYEFGVIPSDHPDSTGGG